MGIGTSIVVMAIGAIMTFAVETDSSNGFNINTAGIILMILGAIGLLVSLAVWGPRRRRMTTVERGPGVARYRETTADPI